jgi:ribulose-bisphosphate carboxylase large chain
MSGLLTVLFGNVSLKAGVLVAEIDIPHSIMERFPGPRFGIDGLRQLTGVAERRPLLCSALKPVGLSPSELADICFQLALGGIDLIKDDHGLSDQETAPLAERVVRCAEAVERANASTGGRSLYFPNITSSRGDLERDIDLVRKEGLRGILVSPLLLGLDTIRALASDSELAIVAHPALSGAYFQPDHGIEPQVLLGQLFRLAGSDGVIYPNVGGRFAFSEATCRAINTALTRQLPGIARSAPVPAGGIALDKVPYWVDQYGPDTVFLIGGSLYEQPDLAEASRNLRKAVSRA